jgi:predicted transcriptional regulator
MTVHVSIAMDETVKAQLDALALTRDLSPDVVVAEAVSAMAADDARLVAAVDVGLASLNAGRGIAHDDVVTALAQARAMRAAR